MYIAQTSIVIYQNSIFYYTCIRACITHEYSTVRVYIQLQKLLKIKAGQAINLQILSISFWSFLQSYLFVVISQAEILQNYLDLFIEPQRGLTRELLYYTRNRYIMNPLVLLSRPYRKSVSIDSCQNILIITSDFRITIYLLYLKQLIDSYNSYKVYTYQIHLVQQVQDISKTQSLFSKED